MPLSGKTILIAEDNTTNRFVVEMQLKKYDCIILSATNGEEALHIYNNNSNAIDLILMDISMPKVDGFKATETIRASKASTAQTVPIIALTAHALKEDKDKCLEAGMNDYLPKPFTDTEFLEVINKHFA